MITMKIKQRIIGRGREAIIAKDFWVCWLLKQLFALPPMLTT